VPINLIHGDCLEKMCDIPDHSVDLVLTDPPYGTTQCQWDSIIPFEPMWEQYKRIIKPNRAIVLTALQPFTTSLIASNMEMFKYTWVWRKNRPVGFMNAKLKPLKAYEDIVVFSEGKTSNCDPNNMIYNPQGLIPCEVKGTKSGNTHKQNDYYRPSHDKGYTQKWTNYPTDVLEVDEKGEGKKVHPTQKPVSLMEYLIRTYTNEGETVLDSCMGSGSTGVACVQTERDFIGIERDVECFKIAEKRIADAIRAGAQQELC